MTAARNDLGHCMVTFRSRPDMNALTRPTHDKGPRENRNDGCSMLKLSSSERAVKGRRYPLSESLV